MIVGLITGGFDPLHLGTISQINEAASRCDILLVGLNSDNWLVRRYGEYHEMWHDRAASLKSLPVIAEVFYFDDSDNTASKAIQYVREKYPKDPIMFMNTDATVIKGIPELTEPGVDFVPV